MSPGLPPPIAAYVAANARLDVEAMVATFAPDAVLVDNGNHHQGHEALRTLFRDEVVAVEAIFVPDTLCQEDGKVVVEGPAHGKFPGSPLRFTYRFTLAGDAIQALEITL